MIVVRPSTLSRLGRGAASAGAVALALALAWWAIVFWPVISNNYLSPAESLSCTIAGSSICDLAQSLCRSSHFLGIKWFSPIATWISVALLSAGIVLTPIPETDVHSQTE
ncbi:hypothetical protein [Aestuariivirga sp.]|uniref:hypothetical protein n=1 Tax=Aestuariivirga sp. TaxID=2650926 RepID=UPI0039E3973B